MTAARSGAQAYHGDGVLPAIRMRVRGSLRIGPPGLGPRFYTQIVQHPDAISSSWARHLIRDEQATRAGSIRIRTVSIPFKGWKA